ncbi:MAG: hypothetical protein Q4D53_07505 [Leptotrichiaceae bacterium]|nr:hypothetical protein [Leptotrichiaceae bacterium]
MLLGLIVPVILISLNVFKGVYLIKTDFKKSIFYYSDILVIITVISFTGLAMLNSVVELLGNRLGFYRPGGTVDVYLTVFGIIGIVLKLILMIFYVEKLKTVIGKNQNAEGKKKFLIVSVILETLFLLFLIYSAFTFSMMLPKQL